MSKNASLESDLSRRRRGWVLRVDSPVHRRKKDLLPPDVRRKTPKVSRYQALQKRMERDPFNGKWRWVDTTNVESASPVSSLNVIDLFSGCGGLSLGFEAAGFRSLMAVELDPDAAKTYRRNFPGARVWDDDIRKLKDGEFLRILDGRPLHVLAAGFPCQGFSVAGKRDPSDERNVLFYEVVRVARVLQPRFVVMENVPGILTMSHGRVIQRIRDEFREAGYPDLSVLVLESAAYGVPQLRPRAILIANRLGLPNPFPRPILDESNYFPIERAIDDLKHTPRDPEINHDWTYHSPQMEERISAVPPGGSLYESFFDAWKRQYRGVPSMTIKENHGGTHIHYELNRTLSAREMARLQSFPDSFFFEGRMKRVMFQVGNAVPPLLGYHVANAVRQGLESKPLQGDASVPPDGSYNGSGD